MENEKIPLLFNLMDLPIVLHISFNNLEAVLLVILCTIFLLVLEIVYILSFVLNDIIIKMCFFLVP